MLRRDFGAGEEGVAGVAGEVRQGRQGWQREQGRIKAGEVERKQGKIIYVPSYL